MGAVLSSLHRPRRCHLVVSMGAALAWCHITSWRRHFTPSLQSSARGALGSGCRVGVATGYLTTPSRQLAGVILVHLDERVALLPS
jgi:hypothetical protein